MLKKLPHILTISRKYNNHNLAFFQAQKTRYPSKNEKQKGTSREVIAPGQLDQRSVIPIIILKANFTQNNC